MDAKTHPKTSKIRTGKETEKGYPIPIPSPIPILSLLAGRETASFPMAPSRLVGRPFRSPPPLHERAASATGASVARGSPRPLRIAPAPSLPARAPTALTVIPTRTPRWDRQPRARRDLLRRIHPRCRRASPCAGNRALRETTRLEKRAAHSHLSKLIDSGDLKRGDRSELPAPGPLLDSDFDSP